jgi:tetratricopeptide (TPR) repeat protein
MKSKCVFLASALLLSVIAFAQKDQIKAAEKALKSGNPQEAVATLNGVQSSIANAAPAEKAYFYSVSGNAYLELANKKVDESNNLLVAAKSFQDLLAVEKVSGKDKYSSQAAAAIVTIKRNLLNSAIDDTKANKNLEGAKKLYDVYLLDKKDTVNLYYAASTYVNAKDYVTALKCYSELKTLNYSGQGTNYLAVNKLTKEDDLYLTAKERDLAVKIGTHEKPRTEKISSKRGEIYKNIALILSDDGKIEEAKKAIADARKLNPEDSSLLYTEANLYLLTKDYEIYKKLVAEALEKNPNDANLVFNLGVLNANAKNRVDAEKYYKRVIEIDPKYINAYVNLAALKLEDEKPIIDEMNKLGTSTKDIKRYEILKTQREGLFKSTIPYLKIAVELDAQNIDVAKTLLNVYNALEMTTEYKELKTKVKEIENK